MLHEGRAEFLRVEPSAPLGVLGPRPKPVTLHFLPGSTLVAFTDGLIERRGRTLDDGLRQLAATAAEGSAQADDLITRLVATLMTDDQEDDLAVVAIRFRHGRTQPPNGRLVSARRDCYQIRRPCGSRLAHPMTATTSSQAVLAACRIGGTGAIGDPGGFRFRHPTWPVPGPDQHDGGPITRLPGRHPGYEI